MRPITDSLKRSIKLINLIRKKRRYIIPISGMKRDTTANLINLRNIVRRNYWQLSVNKFDNLDKMQILWQTYKAYQEEREDPNSHISPKKFKYVIKTLSQRKLQASPLPTTNSENRRGNTSSTKVWE